MSEVPEIRVFLSYAASDRERARWLRRLLDLRTDVRVFTEDALSAGEEWEPKLRTALAESDVFLVLLSDEALQSKWVLQELGAAWALGKRIVFVAERSEDPVRLPVAVASREVVRLSDLEKPEVMERVLRGEAVTD